MEEWTDEQISEVVELVNVGFAALNASVGAIQKMISLLNDRLDTFERDLNALDIAVSEWPVT